MDTTCNLCSVDQLSSTIAASSLLVHNQTRYENRKKIDVALWRDLQSMIFIVSDLIVEYSFIAPNLITGSDLTFISRTNRATQSGYQKTCSRLRGACPQ